MCERYNVGRKTKFLNLKPAEVILGEAASARGQVTIYGISSPVWSPGLSCLKTIVALKGGEEGAAEEEAAYQAISAKETTDLRALMQVPKGSHR